jgi:6-pyruvoyltetrahydropterin/6-carboxytetrahydropterin synthase
MLLSRVVRLALVPRRGCAPTIRAWNEADGWSAAVEIDVTVTGTPDANTGYIVGIQEIDRVVKECASRIIPDSFMSGEPLERALIALRTTLISNLSVPLTSVTIRTNALCDLRSEESMPQHVIVAQRFDFSSSHRLHCPTLSDAENRRVFGKCNNPAGHGHNYRLEVEVRIPLSDSPGLRASDIDRIAREHAVDRLDHKHLNSDVEAFRDRNPSVETIAATCFDWLSGPIRAAGGDLARVRVWETEKTSAIYPG